MHVSIQCFDKAGSADLRQQHIEAHRAHLKNSSQLIRVAGPLLDSQGNNPVGTFIVAEVEDLDQAQALIAADPLSQAGVFEVVKIRPFIQKINNY